MNNKNKYGQYFTVKVIADFMVSLITHPKDAPVLEPSCGEGVFLNALKAEGYHRLAAYEIDPALAANFDCVKHASFVSSPLSERFDVVIGNPPYIRWKNLEDELKAELQASSLWNKYFNSLCDYLFVFILKSIEQLNDGGELIFICTEYWLNTTHSQSLRNYMCTHGVFEEIYHFKESALFEKVSASFIIFKYRKTQRRATHPVTLYRYLGKGVPESTELADRSCFARMEIPPFEVGARWLLAPQQLQDELQNFEAHCAVGNDLFKSDMRRLGDVCDIGNGMVSGLDAAFKIDPHAQLNEAELKATIHVLKAKDLEAYRCVGASRYIWVEGEMSETEFAQTYPHFAQQLSTHTEALQKRYNYGRTIPPWEFVFPRNKKLFDRREPRIFIPCKERITKKNYFRFCLAAPEFYPLQDVTAIFRNAACRESVEYILAYLNNRRVFNWLCYNGIVKGGIVEFSRAPLAAIPFRAIDFDNPHEVEIHHRITTEVQGYLHHADEACLTRIHQMFNLLFDEKN